MCPSNSPIKSKSDSAFAGSSVFDQFAAAPAASTSTTSKLKVPAFSSSTVSCDLITTLGVNSSLVILKVKGSDDANVAPLAVGVTEIASVDSKAVSSIPEILNEEVVDPAGILITGLSNSFLNLYSSLSYAYNIPLNSNRDVTCLNSAKSAVPSTYP